MRDLQTGVKYQFANDRWLAVEYGDGEVGRARILDLIRNYPPAAMAKLV